MTRCPYCHRTHPTRRLGPISIALCTTATPPPAAGKDT